MHATFALPRNQQTRWPELGASALISLSHKDDARRQAVLPYSCRQTFQPAYITGYGSFRACHGQQRSKTSQGVRQNRPNLYALSRQHLRWIGTPGLARLHEPRLWVLCIDFPKMTYGIVLCQNCADQLGSPPLPRATAAATESAITSRS